MVLKLYSGVSFQLQTFLHQHNIQTELLSQQALQNPLCRKYFDTYLAEWGAVLMCPLEWAWIFVTVNLPTHSFDLKLEQPLLLFIWLARRAAWGPCLEGSLEPSIFRRRLLGQTRLPHAMRKLLQQGTEGLIWNTRKLGTLLHDSSHSCLPLELP